MGQCRLLLQGVWLCQRECGSRLGNGAYLFLPKPFPDLGYQFLVSMLNSASVAPLCSSNK